MNHYSPKDRHRSFDRSFPLPLPKEIIPIPALAPNPFVAPVYKIIRGGGDSENRNGRYKGGKQ